MSESTSAKMRMERIERLLHELRYEVERGFMENEIDESIGFTFIVPISRQVEGGVIHCEFRTRPMSHYMVSGQQLKPRLKLIEDGK